MCSSGGLPCNNVSRVHAADSHHLCAPDVGCCVRNWCHYLSSLPPTENAHFAGNARVHSIRHGFESITGLPHWVSRCYNARIQVSHIIIEAHVNANSHTRMYPRTREPHSAIHSELVFAQRNPPLNPILVNIINQDESFRMRTESGTGV